MSLSLPPAVTPMRSLWTLGGLSLPDLLRRTARESWQDSVFGQGGRMAFYQFLAIFPALAISVAIAAHIPHLIDHLRQLQQEVGGQILPGAVSRLFATMVEQHAARIPRGAPILLTCAGALWAALNGTWAMIYGLNRAYEVKEQRSIWELGLTIVGLTFTLAVIGIIAIFVIFFSKRLEAQLSAAGIASRIVDWVVLAATLLIAFAVLYRFAPSLPDHEWRWSTPGAVFALILWAASTFVARAYFDRVNDYSGSYGHLNGVAMLLLWLYVCNGAILIGGEMNSEIEKTAGVRGRRKSNSDPANSKNGHPESAPPG